MTNVAVKVADPDAGCAYYERGVGVHPGRVE
jgi:hypothetical protein